MKIKVEQPSERQIVEMEVEPVWSADRSVFEWVYDSQETCYVIEGRVQVTTSDGEVVTFGTGDMVTFPRGLKCRWDVREPIRKHYRFE